MAFLVCHMQKLGSGALGGIQSHNNRERESKTNPDIDKSKSEDNYSLVECESYRQAIKDNIAQLDLKKAVRKDAVLACSFVITSSQDFFKTQTPEEQKAFFADTVKFFQDRYGEKNIIAAHVHMDETTPHMHLLLTPIRDKKLSAKAIFDRKELRALQTDLHTSVGRSRSLERGKEGSDRAHLSENRFKAEKAREAATAAEQKLAELTPKILTAAEVENIQGKKTLLSNALKNVSYTEYLSLKQTAAHAEKMEQRAISADLRADLAEQREAKTKNEVITEYGKIMQEKKDLEQERAAIEKAKSETPSALLQKKIERVTGENNSLKSVLNKVYQFLKFDMFQAKKTLQPEQLQRMDSIKKELEQSRGKGLGR